MARLTLHLFGTPRIERDGSPVGIGQRKAVALLAYLAVTGRSHARASVANLLWPEHEAASAMGEVRRALWVLNRALGKGWLRADRRTIALESDVDVAIDVRRFRDLLESWRNHGHGADEVCPDCLGPLTEAIALAHGPFLAGFGLADSAGFDDWQAEVSHELEQRLRRALMQRISLVLDGARVPPAETFADARRWLALDPLSEPCHRLLMALHAASDRPGEAVRQYEACVERLRSELGVAPSAETTALHERIRAGAFDAAEAFAEAPVRVVAGPVQPEPARGGAPAPNVGASRLPGQPTPFVGRAFEIAALKGLLLDPDHPLVSIVAPGGMGKTRLAIEVGGRVADRFEHGVVFVDLAPLGDGADIAAAIADAAGYRVRQDGRSRARQVQDYLAAREVLLILDNFEHLLDAADTVSELLASSPRLTLLVTSRQRLALAGETLFTLQGMRLSAAPPDAFARSSAAELFVQSARRARPDFEPTPDELAPIDAACRLLQGMPLAILLAAQWVTVLTAAEIVAEIEAGLDILEAEGRELPERQRSMRAVLDQSWSRMDDGERRVFMKLSVFRGGFTRDAGERIAGAGLRQLQSLTNRGLLERDDDRQRFHLHELLRQYAAERLERSGQGRRIRRDASRHFLALLGARVDDLKGSAQDVALRRIEVEFDNVREGWEGAVEERDLDLLATALEALHLFCLMRGRWESGRAMFDRARGALAPEAGEEPHPIWLALGIRLNRAEESRTLLPERLERSLHEARRRDDPSEAAYCLHALAAISHFVDEDPSQAIAHYEAAAAIYRRLGERYYLAQTLQQLGEAYQLVGRTDRTQALIDEALQLQREVGDAIGEAETLRAHGMAAYSSGDYERCVGYLAQQTEIGLRSDDRVGLAASHLFMGWMLCSKGALAEGRDLLQRALDTALDVVDHSTQAWAHTFLAFVESLEGGRSEAAAHLARAEAIETDPFRQAGAGNPFLQLQVAFTSAFLACDRSDFDEARRRLPSALRTAVRTASDPYTVHSLAVAIPIVARDGAPELAASLFGRIEGQSVWAVGWTERWTALRRVRAELVAELGDARFDDAYALGGATDLAAVAAEVLRALGGAAGAA